MKKSLIALALMGAFSGAAVAQSNVTLYGILDVNFMWQELRPRRHGTATGQQEARHQQRPPVGQPLGPARHRGAGWRTERHLHAGRRLQHRSGTSGKGGRLFGRQAYAGLSGSLGAVVAGRLATFSSGTGDFDMIGRVDPFLTGFGLASAGNTFISMNAPARGQHHRLRVADVRGLQGRPRLLV